VTFVDCSTMKRVSMMLLVLLAMSVQPVLAGKNKNQKTNQKKKNQKKTHLRYYREKGKLLTVKHAADIVNKDKAKKKKMCQWSGNLRGTGKLRGPGMTDGRATRLFEPASKLRFQHLIGTSNDDGHERKCIVWVGENSQLFEPKPGIRTSSSGYTTRLAAKSASGPEIFKDGPQLGARSLAMQGTPKMWKWASSRKSNGFAWQMNYVAAHVEIQEMHGGVWTSLGSWLIPTTKSSNSQTSKKCLGQRGSLKNPNAWQHLRTPVTAIKLKKVHPNCPPNSP